MADDAGHRPGIAAGAFAEPGVEALKQVFAAAVPGFKRSAESAGVSVRATMPEMMTEMLIVMANCRYMVPARPCMKATGTNTAHSTSTMAMMGPVTCSMALMVASRGGSPSSA